MSINRKLILTAAIGLAFGVSSCKKYLNVNTNPNGAQAATVATLLPAGQLYLGSAVGNDLEIAGSFFAQYWTQNPGASQYHNLDQYAPGQDGFSTPWTNLYLAGENFFQLYKLADTLKEKQYMAISLIMRAYTFQILADGWGDVPFSQALKGQYADGHVVNPKYDSLASVYRGIIAMLDSANVLINPNDAVVPGADDLVYGGNMTKWQAFSNTLALRVYMRMSQVDPITAKAGVLALYSNPATAVFLGVGDDAAIQYGWNSANANPLYAEETGLSYVQNIVASSTCVDSMNNNGDPRAYAFYGNTNGTVTGLAQGLYNTAYSGVANIPSIYVGADAAKGSGSNTAPVNFMTSYESLFLQAEAAARTWDGGAGDDQALFYNAIQANFAYYAGALGHPLTNDGLYLTLLPGDTAFTGSSYKDYINGAITPTGAPGYWTVYPAAGTTAQKVQFIITQKWFAMCGNQGFEAWTEWRRTGYPDFLVYSISSIIGNNFPKRCVYPTSESTTNSNYPGLQPITSKVWWDLL